MTRWILRFSVLVAALAFASGAYAQVNLSWNDCGSFGVADKTSLCNSNTGVAGTMVASFISPNAPSFVAIEGYIDMIEANPTLLPWWEMASGCRAAGGHIWSADFTLDSGNCNDFFAGAAGGGGGVLNNFLGLGTNTQRFKCTFAIPGAAAMAAGVETYGFKLSISRSNTLSCAGCTDPVCLVLNRIRVNQPAFVGDFDLTGAAPSGRDYVTWQGGAGAPCATVPTQNRTWGQVKALYH